MQGHSSASEMGLSRIDYSGNDLMKFGQYEEVSVIREKLSRIENALNESVSVPASLNSLTVIIAFYNEREEVVNTVKSIRATAGYGVDIIAVNDCSDDGFPYLSELSKYNVTYYVNKDRLGAALSKERGIRLAVTPYFIVLDAHMRIYTEKWHEILIENLKNKPLGIACCQSVVLVKQEDGDVRRIENNVKTKGAYLSFRYDCLVPGIHWFTNVEESPDCLNKDEIAAVLGGCYASSKSYWDLIDGYDGLLYYGCEEAYISIKAWLQGAGCRIISDIEIGHVYRTVPNFDIAQSSFMYNYLVIADVCFPESECRKVHLMAQTYSLNDYNEAQCIIAANYAKIKFLKDKWRVFHDRLYKVRSLNMQFALAQSGQWGDVCARISEVASFVCEHYLFGMGLIDGAMGDLLFLSRYIDFMKITDGDVVDRCIDLYSSILKDIDKESLPWNFESGYAGIGWGILYLRDYGLIEDDVSVILRKVDEKLSCLSPKRIVDSSLYKGLKGLAMYVGRRIMDSDNRIDVDFLIELRDQCLAQDLMSVDRLCRETAAWECDHLPLEIGDIVRPMHFIPRSKKQWNYGLEGVTGHVLQLMEIKQSWYYEKK